MQQINVNELIPHPRNNEFFDDITGDKWQELLDSIRKRIHEGKRGNIEPIVITQDKIIVSGHQRVRAFIELNILTIDAEVRIYESDDAILLDLLESNIRRRGDVGGSAKKMGLRIKELERIYGICNGGKGANQYVQLSNKSKAAPSQEDVADELNISVATLQNYKLLADMIPELSDLVDTGIVTKTTALAMMRNLSKKEQEELIASMDTTERIPQKQVQQYIDKIKELESRNPEVQIIEKEKIVDKTDYSLIDKNRKLLEDLKKISNTNMTLEIMNKNLEKINETNDRLLKQYKANSEEYMQVKSRLIDMGLQPDGQYNLVNAATEIAKLTSEIEEILINKLAPLKYKNFMIAVQSNETLKQNFANTLGFVRDWYESMMDFAGISKCENYKIIDMEEK